MRDDFNILCNPVSALRFVHPRVSGTMAFKGGNKTTGTQTVVNELPDYARPYYERLMERSEAASLEGYTPYGGQRLAEVDPFTNKAYGMVEDIAGGGISGLDTAQGVVGQNIVAGQNIAAGATPFQFSAPGEFDTVAANKYMSPYVENVLNRQMDAIQREYNMQQGSRDAAAVGAGAFGGSRRFVQDALAQEAANRQKGDIYAAGMQNAYEQASQQYGADRAARMSTEQAQASADSAARAEQLQALGFSADQAQQLAGYGEMGRAADIQGAQLLEQTGLARQGQAQAGLDLAYQDFLRQQGYPQEQINFMSSIMNNMPIAPNTTSTTTAPHNPLQDVLGAGISAYGLYKSFNEM